MKLIMQNSAVKILMLIFLVILSWSTILGAIGASRVDVEVENFVRDHTAEIEQSLTAGDLVHIQKVLWRLNLYGIEGLRFSTSIFWNNENRIISIGHFNTSKLGWTKSIKIQRNGLNLGELSYHPAIIAVAKRSLISQWPLLAILILINFSLVVTINYLVILEIRKVEKNVINVINSDEPTEAAKLKLLTLNKNIFVSTPLSQSLENLILKINQLNKMKIEHSKNKTARDIAKQVAHDIRAPLSALNIVASKLSNADESVVGLMTAAIKRINDIASDLLKKNETLPEESHMQFCELQKNFRELQLEFNTRFPSIQFDLNFMKIPEEQLFLINKKNFSRALSNLLNNAAEAIQHDHGKICIDIQSQPDGLLIKMSDNGSGIPKEIIDKHGQSGFSYNKSNGNGLGLAHAFNTVKSTGGSILINSKLGEGTDINIKILRFTGNAYHNLNFI